ncbi:hypothetical protein K7711_32415 [Nocardia sp. CA2R105]|uniref:hypothetical protein n=1 Tax=Nocardia coffeae TaxID=2873381 RepID=UPI001CA75891|nr:hypothetical protein [Nocardia coffeae]MBY8861220.1 hypothetical protein [Nocardia coffeae]
MRPRTWAAHRINAEAQPERTPGASGLSWSDISMLRHAVRYVALNRVLGDGTLLSASGYRHGGLLMTGWPLGVERKGSI